MLSLSSIIATAVFDVFHSRIIASYHRLTGVHIRKQDSFALLSIWEWISHLKAVFDGLLLITTSNVLSTYQMHSYSILSVL